MRLASQIQQIAAVVVGLSFLAGCQKSTASVSLHGINHSDTEFSYFLLDPENPERVIGGEHIDPFSGGGITCCALLPRKWQSGTKIRVRTVHWLEKHPDGSLPEVKKEHQIDVPRYAVPEELWVLRAADGKISVIASNVEPDHPQWPGAIKGWPLPSLKYRRERWELYRQHEEGSVDAHIKLIEDLKNNPKQRTAEAWAFAKERDPSSIEGFFGPDDPRYPAALKNEYEQGLAESRKRLKLVMEARP